MKETIIVFARNPELGKVKTRLAKEIGANEALQVYKQLLEHTLSIVEKTSFSCRIYWSEKSEGSNSKIQQGRDLGEKMYNAIQDELNTSTKVCLIGTDTPFITEVILQEAFHALNEHDIVFGPAKDGGYYLVALKAEPIKSLFIEKTWSHSGVLEVALEVCKENNLSSYLTPVLLDIDTHRDLQKWQQSD